MNDLQLYKKIASVLECGENAALITVISTEGSTPGKVGYKMLLWGAETRTVGTVGGGLTENQVVEAAAAMLSKSGTSVLRFDLAGTAEDERGICGGTIEFLIEIFDTRYLQLFKEIIQKAVQGRGGILISVISPPAPPNKFFVEDLEQIPGQMYALGLSQEDSKSILSLGEKEDAAKIAVGEDVAIFAEAFVLQPMLLIFGAGHLATHIARLAGLVDFRVTVCDERPEYANRERFPDADKIVVSSFDTVCDKLTLDENCYVVIVTRGHRCDEKVLEQVLGYSSKYVGMIGSKRKTLTVLDSLRNKGLDAQKLAGVYAPIGISIGALTPEEIALSIVSELVKIKRLGDSVGVGHMKIDFAPRKVRDQR
jgi:xanthine dehydrogenase accessory factor